MRGRGVKFGTTAVHHLCIIPSRFALWLLSLWLISLGKRQIGPNVSPVLHNRLPDSKKERRLLEV